MPSCLERWTTLQNPRVKEQVRWIQDCQRYLRGALKATKKGDLDGVKSYIEEMIVAESMAKSIVEYCDTYSSKGYVNNLTRLHMCLIRSLNP